MSGEDPLRQPDQLADILAPEQTEQLFGHEQTQRAVLRQVALDRVPGAIMLHGPRGIGKATLAFALARDILAQTGDEPVARVRDQIAQGVHPNLFVLRRAQRDANGFYTQIRVEDVRSLQQRLRQTRGRAGHRICVIDSVDDCNKSAANALLKILEEPPAESVFMVISHRPGGLLPTIRSRCQAHAMRGISDDDVTAAIRQQIADVAPGDLQTAISLAAGRPRRGCEALLLEKAAVLEELRLWLADPLAAQKGAQLSLAASIAGAGDAEADFARDMISNWLAQEADEAARSGPPNRLASASELWEKAQAALREADIYNLDARQTLISIFDALISHMGRFSHRAPGLP